MRRVWIIMLIILGLSACSKDQEKLRIGIIKPSIDHLPLTYALKLKAIDENFNEIVYFNSGWEAQEALVNNKLDVAILPFTYVWTARSKGYPIKTLSFFERETDGILVDKSIKSLQDLNSKKIALLKASTLDAFMSSLAKKLAISYEAVYFRTPSEMIAALKAGEVSAIVTYVPIIQKLSDEFQVLYWFSNDNPEHPCCNLACTENAIQNNRKRLTNLMNILNKVINNLDEKDTELMAFIKTNYQLNDEQAKDALAHSVFKMNLASKDKQFEYETMKTFLELKYIETIPNAQDIYDESFISALE